MSYTSFLRLTLVALCLTLAVSALAADEDAPDHVDLPHVFVRITDGGLHPAVLDLTTGDAFGWVNYSRRIARVSFDAAIAKKMTCKSEGSFRRTGDRLESADLQAQQFATLCSLAPGEYPYRVELRSGVGQGGEAPPSAREGRLVVK